MPSYGLTALRTWRLDQERQAERALAAALAARARAHAEAARLAEELAAAASALTAARATPPEALARAGVAQATRRYWERLAAAIVAAESALTAHRDGPLAQAIADETTARTEQTRARRRRELVDKAISRRDERARREADRRREMTDDDQPRPKP